MARVTLNGQDIDYEVHGAGMPVLAVRNVAAPTGTWPTRGDIAAFGEAGCSVISYSHHGTSDSVGAIAADVVALIEHLDLGPVGLFGYSQGAMTAQEVALARPDLVRSAVMMATRGRLTAYDTYRYRVEDEMSGTDGGRLFAILQSYPAGAICDDELFERLVAGYGAFSEQTDDQRSRSERAARAGAAYRDRLEALRGVTVPCMVVAFSHDVNIPPVLNREVADAIPGCTYVEIDGAGHSGGVTHRVQVREHVIPFLSRPRP
jgi:pimeloyl-ACP methyl ester carboxylesterase